MTRRESILHIHKMSEQSEPTTRISSRGATALLRVKVAEIILKLQAMQEKGDGSMCTFGPDGGLKQCEEELQAALDKHREREG